MAKDVKIEILYYKHQNDVSLEFGLRGDYPLRMLSSVCDDIPSFFHGLKRAVSRSEIIIIVGGYNEDDHLPTFIARVLGKKCSVPDYCKHGVLTEEKYLLPEDAVPIAPKNRLFGGFLLECGPQAIISLNDNKKTRMELVEQFLVNYIAEHHRVFNKPFAIEKDDVETKFDDSIVISATPTDFFDISSTSVVELDAETTSDIENEDNNDLDSVILAHNETESENDTTDSLVIGEISTSKREKESTDKIIQVKTRKNKNVDIQNLEIAAAIQDETATNDELDSSAFNLAINGIEYVKKARRKPHLNIDPDDLFLNDYDKHYDSRHRRKTVRTICLVFSIVVLICLMVLLILTTKTNSTNAATNTSGIISSSITPAVSTPSNDNHSDSTSETSKWTPSTDEESKPEGDITENDFHGETSDIVLPLPPVLEGTTSTSSASNNTSSSNTSTELSSSTSSYENTSSDISTTTSSEESVSSSVVTSSQKPVSSVSAPSSSSQVTSSKPITSSTVSASNSSTVTSSATNPNIDPIYTWDLQLSCIDKADGKKYTDSAVMIVAMIIEDEMSPTIDPREALIAQAIVKYNWLINNNARDPNKAPTNALDPNPTPQAIEAAQAAKGMVLMYGNTLAKTYCYAYSAGMTANIQDIWGGTAYPYLQSVDCSVDKDLKDFETSTTYSAELIQKIILNTCGVDVSDMDKTEWIKPVQYDNNGLYCLKVSIGGKEYNGRYLRETLLVKSKTEKSDIRSTAYTITYNETDDTFTVTCKGYGHGVGFSQRGAKTYAYNGWDHEQILLHFFPGTTLIKV